MKLRIQGIKVNSLWREFLKRESFKERECGNQRGSPSRIQQTLITAKCEELSNTKEKKKMIIGKHVSTRNRARNSAVSTSTRKPYNSWGIKKNIQMGLAEVVGIINLMLNIALVSYKEL